MELSSIILRRSLAGLGAGSIAFGMAPVLAPRLFSRLFGIASLHSPTGDMVARSLGIRDLVTGAGILFTRHDGSANHVWLSARLAFDVGDAFACALALTRERGNVRLWALTGIALGASAVDWLLLRDIRKTH